MLLAFTVERAGRTTGPLQWSGSFVPIADPGNRSSELIVAARLGSACDGSGPFVRSAGRFLLILEPVGEVIDPWASLDTPTGS